MAKQDIRQIEFTCDLKGCGKKIKVEQKIVCGVKQPSPFPYGKKWVYLYAFNWKHALGKKSDYPVDSFGKKCKIPDHLKGKGLISDHTDKHFCCRAHLIKFVTERVQSD